MMPDLPPKKHNSPKVTSMALLVCFSASFFYIYDFFLRIAPSAITQDLMRDFALDAQGLGMISACFFYAYSAMQIPAGLLLDHFGPRMVLSIAIAVCGGAAVLSGLTHYPSLLALSRFLIGFSSSFAYVGALLLAARWLPDRYFALTAGVVQAMGCLGAMAGEAPVAFLADQFGWRAALYTTGVLGFVFALFFWLIIRDHPHPKKWVKTHRNTLMELSQILKNPQTWFIFIAEFSAWAPVSALAALWGIPFLMSRYHTTTIKASALISLIWLGVALGGPFMGWWSDRIGSRNTPLRMAFLLALVSSLGMVYIPQMPCWLMAIFLLLFGVAASAQAITFGIIKDIQKPSIAATGVGFNNMAAVLGGLLLHPIMGMMLTQCWDGTMHHGAPMYSLTCYQYAFIFLPLCALVGLITTQFLIRETHCTVQHTP